MGNNDTKIQMKEMPECLVRYPEPPLPHRYHPPFRKFGKVQEKKSGRIITYTLSVTDPYLENMVVEAEVFDKLYDVYNLKTEKIFIDGILKEENVLDRWIFNTSDATNTHQSLLIRPYTDQTSHNFSSILCEVYFAKMIKDLNCPYLHNIVDNFIIRTGIDLLDEPNSHVIVMEKVDVTLSQVIAYKRKHHWDWTNGEFCCLAVELVQALNTLHKAKITHNDIRPPTIYYSIKKKCYVLGSYSSCMREGSSGAIVRRNSRRQVEQGSEVDRKQYDVFLLGMALMSAFYLSEVVDSQLLIQQNKRFQDKYPILQIIDAMIAPPAKRARLDEILNKLPKKENVAAHHYMYQMICSLKHRERPSPAETVSQKIAISWAYKNLGLWNQWKKQYQEGFQLTETQITEAEQAEGKMNLALIDHCRGQFRSSDAFAKEAAKKYRELGSTQLQVGCNGAAQSYYKKAVNCAKFYELDPDPDLAQSLSGLSIVHKDRSSYKYSKTLASAASKVVLKAQGRNTISFGSFRLKEARLLTQFGEYQASQKVIDECLVISDRLKQINHQGSLHLRAEALVVQAKNYDKWGENLTELQQHSILDKSKTAARQAVQTYQYIDEDHLLELADVVKTVGDVNIKRRNYYESIRQYSRSIGLINSYLQKNNKEEVKQKAEVLCLRGTAHSLVGEHDQGITDHLEALRIYKALYGSHHNKCSALAIGNLGKIYLNTKQKQQGIHCLKTSMQILSEVTSRQDPEYLNFQKIIKNVDDVRE